MTTTTRNEAAKPTTDAGKNVADWLYYDWDQEFNVGHVAEEESYRKQCDAAVAAVETAERRATVERIRAAVAGRTWGRDVWDEDVADRINAILDEEAAR